jgi:hypothetical protein
VLRKDALAIELDKKELRSANTKWF